MDRPLTFEPEEVQDIFIRNRPDTRARLEQSVVGIAGLGGLGSNIAVHLVRAGVGSLILTDFDRVEPSNLNRQHYFQKHIGMKKSEALGQILLEINPQVKLTLWDQFIDPTNLTSIYDGVDVMVEAFDQAQNKSMLVNEWLLKKKEIPLVCASGMAGIGPANEVMTRRFGKHLVVVGDLETEATREEGLCAPRVALAAAHQGHAVIRLLLGMEVI